MLTARRLVLRGRVQGVGFRFFIDEAARHEGLGGWVANRTDGTVEILVEGDRESVARFEAKARRGPRLARIDGIDSFEDTPSGGPLRFTVRP